MLATTVAAVSLAGCTLLLVSTDGLSGGAVDAAATLPPGAEGGDGDVRPGEGGPSDEGSVDAADADGGDTSIGFCAANPGHRFCDDFDDRTNVATKWTSTDLSGRGIIVSDTALSRSAPRSFSSSTMTGASVVSTASVAFELGNFDKVRLSFDFHAATPTGTVGDSIATVHFTAGYFDLVWFDNGRFGVTERADPMPPIDHFSPTFMPLDTWVHMVIEVTPGQLVVKLDGTIVVDVATTRAYSGGAGFTLGLYSEDTRGVTFHYDNVLADTAF
ncbi:MAG: hypothetical protein JWO86_6163 [Myxococcaceae bacterium]|nr:hypothetical protein [Myxococcaceae bacterium]